MSIGNEEILENNVKRAVITDLGMFIQVRKYELLKGDLYTLVGHKNFKTMKSAENHANNFINK